MSDVTIRPARPDELDAVGALTVRAYAADGPIVGNYAQTLANAHDRALEAELLVAVDGADALMGTVTIAQGGQKWADIAHEDELEFRMLAVAPAARRRGVGEALVRVVLARARELGVTGVVMSSQTSMTVAHRIYERLGFHRLPARDWIVPPDISLIAYGMLMR